jgi:hypothetical protein
MYILQQQSAASNGVIQLVPVMEAGNSCVGQRVNMDAC